MIGIFEVVCIYIGVKWEDVIFVSVCYVFVKWKVLVYFYWIYDVWVFWMELDIVVNILFIVYDII